jgi:phosphoribosyl 1,2-cyclic phosphodiesterase
VHLTFCGCRGSTPVSGPQFQRYGAATSCVAVAAEAGAPPHLVLDAGTGFMHLDRLLGAGPFEGTVLISHLHWDHTHGLPFLRQASMPGHRVDVRIPGQDGDAEEVMNRAFSPPHFPVPFSTLGENWSIAGIEPGTYEMEGYTVLAREIPHKGSRTFGYRVSDGRSSVAYLSDHKPLALGPGPDGIGEYHPAALELADGVDLLVHDAQHLASEMPALAFLGHSAVEYALGLGAAAGAQRVALFHHDPRRSDEQIEAIEYDVGGRSPVPFLATREWATVTLPAERAPSDPAPAVAADA